MKQYLYQISLAILIAMLYGCGQMGPLYLPSQDHSDHANSTFLLDTAKKKDH